MLELTDQLKTNIDDQKITCGIFLDLSKAFDTVNHSLLLQKLYRYGIRGTPLVWLTNYLNNRMQYVEIDGVRSSNLKVNCGVPQGSTLGPLLFLIYVNDMPNCSKKVAFRIFADDTALFYSSKNSNELQTTMQQEFQHLLDYCKANNFSKSHYVVISPQRKKSNITIPNIEKKELY